MRMRSLYAKEYGPFFFILSTYFCFAGIKETVAHVDQDIKALKKEVKKQRGIIDLGVEKAREKQFFIKEFTENPVLVENYISHDGMCCECGDECEDPAIVLCKSSKNKLSFLCTKCASRPEE